MITIINKIFHLQHSLHQLHSKRLTKEGKFIFTFAIVCEL